MAVIDVTTFNGEADLLEIRLNILDPYVDQFIIVEATSTFSGKSKPLYFERDKERFSKWLRKIRYFPIYENDYFIQEYLELARNSPNVPKGGPEHWTREFCQKECIKKAITHLKDDDIVFIGDVDEIWTPNALLLSAPFKLKLEVYTYFLNNRSSEEFWGTLVSRYMHVRLACLNHLRSEAWKTNFKAGWHFTSMGGYEEVKRKLGGSYTEDSYWSKPVQDHLEQNIKERRDFLGRDFTYTVDESAWPQWLKDNKERYKHLCL